MCVCACFAILYQCITQTGLLGDDGMDEKASIIRSDESHNRYFTSTQWPQDNNLTSF